MKVAVVFVLISGICFVSSESSDATAEIVKQEDEPSIDGNYHFLEETSNGIKISETGTLQKAEGGQNATIIVEGSYSYTGPDGEVVEVKYKADPEHGFQAEGSHLPTPPPIPEAIQKALDYIASVSKDQKAK